VETYARKGLTKKTEFNYMPTGFGQKKQHVSTMQERNWNYWEKGCGNGKEEAV